MTDRIGILLAGGSGSRLKPLTDICCKQLLPVYDKPMIYYPLSILMLTGIREIVIISTIKDLPKIKELLGDGSELGVKFHYKIQDKPNGIAEAFIIAEDIIQDKPTALVLGDNIFFGSDLDVILQKVCDDNSATVFGYQVPDPERYGVVNYLEDKVISIIEKPEVAPSNFIVPGLYFYPANVLDYVKLISKSDRNELEITDLNNIYAEKSELKLHRLGRGFAWFDCGTFDSLLLASQFVSTIQNLQNVKIADLTEISKTYNWI